MTGFFSELLQRGSEPATRLSRYTERCGYFYLAVGMGLLFAPTGPVAVGLLPAYEGQEEALIRLLGLTLGVVGYFYVFGGRTQQPSFGLATVLDRLLVPGLLGFVYMASHVELMIVLPLAILDPILGIGAYILWRRDEAEATG
ncbi:MAG: hypothetical protein ACPGU1_17750 [Myxococcota bacterium]